MMLLPFTTEQAAIERNMIEAIRRGCDMVNTRYWWPMLEYGDGWALAVGDGDGLSVDEQTRVVNELPEQTNGDGINP
jgi:hypothetical protein